MNEQGLIDLLPAEFWVAVVALTGIAAYAIANIRRGIGLPLLAVVATVAFWYVGDVVYNDYGNNHFLKFPPQVLSFAWVQVVIFAATLFLGVIIIHPVANRDCAHLRSRIFGLYERGADFPEIQSTLNLFSRICWIIWLALIGIAIFNIGARAINFAFPFLGIPINPFVRGRVASGPLASLFSLATNFHVLVGSGFGLVAALSNNSRIRALAIVGCLMTWPYFLLSRVRNTMLACCVPGILAFVFVRVRWQLSVKVIVLLVAVFVGDTWLRFVMEARNNQVSVANYFFQRETEDIATNDTRHAGLNMFEELCWLGYLIENGKYQPNMGMRYFAEISNPVPRALWPGKPMIGIDYALARGQQFERAGSINAGIGASISTGMIGQGVDNFGVVFGPIASGLLMSLWVVLLARIDLHAESNWRLPLYAIGLVLTFNCGRDVTLLVLYPFVFGLVIVKALEWYQQQANASV